MSASRRCGSLLRVTRRPRGDDVLGTYRWLFCPGCQGRHGFVRVLLQSPPIRRNLPRILNQLPAATPSGPAARMHHEGGGISMSALAAPTVSTGAVIGALSLDQAKAALALARGGTVSAAALAPSASTAPPSITGSRAIPTSNRPSTRSAVIATKASSTKCASSNRSPSRACATSWKTTPSPPPSNCAPH